tara:strand:- start:643 stop:774 length:132 start_codon:yes stop_codon:yes gene_type:complete
VKINVTEKDFRVKLFLRIYKLSNGSLSNLLDLLYFPVEKEMVN